MNITTPNFLSESVFQLINNFPRCPGELVAEILIPAGIKRQIVREWLQTITSVGKIIHQRCIGNEQLTTNWSKVVIKGNQNLYQELAEICGSRQPQQPTLTYKQLMKEDFAILKAIASERNITVSTKPQLCKELKNKITQQDIDNKIQEFKESLRI